MWRINGRRLLVLAMALAAAAVPAQVATVRPVAAASGCDPVWTDPSGDAYSYLPYQGAPAYVGFYQPQLDMVSGTFWRSGSDLVVRVHVADMGPQYPDGRTAESWETRWRIGTVDTYVVATHSLLGDYYVFTRADGGNGWAAGSIVPGTDGYAEVDVPLAQVGSPAPSTPVSFEGARAWEWLASFAVAPVPVDLSPVVTWDQPLYANVLGDPVDLAPGGGSTIVGATCP